MGILQKNSKQARQRKENQTETKEEKSNNSIPITASLKKSRQKTARTSKALRCTEKTGEKDNSEKEEITEKTTKEWRTNNIRMKAIQHRNEGYVTESAPHKYKVLTIYSVNVTKSIENCGFDHIYWRNSQGKTSFFVEWQDQQH